MKNEGCRFCDNVAEIKRFNRVNKLGKDGLYHSYKAALVVTTYRRGAGKRGSMTFRAGPLNFCPECGRPLKRQKESSPGGT